MNLDLDVVTKPLKVSLGGFAIAALGVVFSFATYAIDWRAGRFVGFGITALGVLLGFVAVIWGLIAIARDALRG